MGAMHMMVERDYNNQLFMGAYHRMMQTSNDDMIVWPVTVISKAWSDYNDSFTLEDNIPIRSHIGRSSDDYKWVCITDVADIHTDTTAQGYFRILSSEDKREYGDAQLYRLKNRNAGKVDTVKEERHELTLLAERNATEPPIKIKEPPRNGMDHIKANVNPYQTKDYMAQVSKKASPSKEKIVLSDDNVQVQDPDIKSTSRDKDMRLHQGGRRDPKLAAASGSTRRITPGILPQSLIWKRHSRNQQVDQPVDAGRDGPAGAGSCGEPRCDARHMSRRDASATPTTPTAPGVISD
jgi:hypothetical protein